MRLYEYHLKEDKFSSSKAINCNELSNKDLKIKLKRPFFASDDVSK